MRRSQRFTSCRLVTGLVLLFLLGCDLEFAPHDAIGGDAATPLAQVGASFDSATPLPAHHGNIISVAFSDDGKHVLSGGADGTVILWDRDSGSPQQRYQGHLSTVCAVTVVSQRCVSADRDGRIAVWRSATGKVERELVGHTDAVVSLKFCKGLGLLASAGQDRTIRLWDLETGRCVKTLSMAGGVPNAIEFPADGKSVVVGLSNESLEVWDIASATRKQRWWVPGKPTCLALHPSRPIAAACGIQKHVEIIDLATAAEGSGKNIMNGVKEPSQAPSWYGGTMSEVQEQASSAAVFCKFLGQDHLFVVRSFGDCAEYLISEKSVTASHDSVKMRWNAPDLLSEAARCLAVSPDGKALAVALGSRLGLYDCNTGATIWTKAASRECISSVVFGSTTDALAVGTQAGAVFVLSPAMAARRCEGSFSERVAAMAWGPRDETLVACDFPEIGPDACPIQIVIWDSTGGGIREKMTIPSLPAEPIAVSFSPEKREVILGDAGGSVRRFQCGDGKPHDLLRVGTDEFQAGIAVDGTGITVIGSITESNLGFWDGRSFDLLRRLPIPRGCLPISLALSRDGKTITAIGLERQSVHVLDASTGKPIRVVTTMDENAIARTAISGDGQTVAVLCENGLVAAFDVKTGCRVGTWRGSLNGCYATCIALNRNGERIAFSENDGSLRVHRVKTGDEVMRFYALDDGKRCRVLLGGETK